MHGFLAAHGQRCKPLNGDSRLHTHAHTCTQGHTHAVVNGRNLTDPGGGTTSDQQVASADPRITPR